MNSARRPAAVPVARRLALARLAVGLAAAGICRAGAASAPPGAAFTLQGIEPPRAAPAFELPRLGGGRISLGELRGRYLLVNFWATWCPPCVAEMPALQRLHERCSHGGLTVVGISLDQDGAQPVGVYARELGLTFTIALDVFGTVAREWGVTGLPSSYLVDRAGQVVGAAIGERDWDSPRARSFFDALLR